MKGTGNPSTKNDQRALKNDYGGGVWIPEPYDAVMTGVVRTCSGDV